MYIFIYMCVYIYVYVCMHIATDNFTSEDIYSQRMICLLNKYNRLYNTIGIA